MAASPDSERTTADEIRAIASQLLADSETRSSLVADGGTGGWDKGFYIASSDNNFRLNVKGFMQFRYYLNFRQDDGPDADTFESGFQVARTVMFFKGHIYSPKLFYQIRTNFKFSDGTMVLDDAFVGYKINDNWTVRWGQALYPFDREWYHGDVKLQGIERSIVALMFGAVRGQFLDVKYQNDDVRLIGVFSDGLRSVNTDYTADPAEWAVTGRGEWKFAGAWSQVGGQATSPRDSEYAGALSVALHYEQGPDTGAPGMTQQGLFAWTADLVTKGDGWNIMLVGVGYHATDEAGVPGANFNDYGWFAQGGIYATDDIEFYGRFSQIIPDGDRVANDTFSTLTAGFNWYWHGQAAKFTLQGQYFFDPTTGTVAGNFGNRGGRNPTSSFFGLLPSDEGGQVAITAQFQLLF